MSPVEDVTLSHRASADAVKIMSELCDVYADAYGAVPGEDTQEKSSAFRERASARNHVSTQWHK